MVLHHLDSVLAYFLELALALSISSQHIVGLPRAVVTAQIASECGAPSEDAFTEEKCKQVQQNQYR